MNLIKKIWHDENSEPPKNYLWDKGGKLFKYTEGQWKEVGKQNPSGDDHGDEEKLDPTIDDVVLFIHNKMELENEGSFPYTTWAEIPNVEDADAGCICKGEAMGSMETLLLNLNGCYIGYLSDGK